MKFCMNCGRELADKDNYCPDCGFKSLEKVTISKETKEKLKRKSNQENFEKYLVLCNEHMKLGNLGLYRNDIFCMSEIEKSDGHYLGQLKLLCIIFYMDLSGADTIEECMLVLDGELPIDKPVIAPGIVTRMRTAMKRCGFDEKKLIEYYRISVSETMVYAHIYTKRQTEELLLMAIEKGGDEVNKLIKQPKKYSVINIRR